LIFFFKFFGHISLDIVEKITVDSYMALAFAPITSDVQGVQILGICG
jgi:hypothetical protein